MSDITIHQLNSSGGRTSAYLTEHLLKKFKEENELQNVKILFANTGKESEQTLQFVKQCSERWQNLYGTSVTWLEYTSQNEAKFKIVSFETASRKGEPFKEMVLRGKTPFIPNFHRRICTQTMKVETMERYMRSLGYKAEDITVYIGIRYDEPRRWSKMKNTEDASGQIKELPLVAWKVTKEMVLQFWKAMPFDLQLSEPYGNCDLCFLKSPKKKLAIIKENPKDAEFWSELEKLANTTFDPAYSYEHLVKIAHGTNDFSKFHDISIECTCNID